MQATLPSPLPTPTPVATWLTLSSGWIALGFLAFLGLAILYLIFTGRIDLSRLISEPNGDASMSRFQLLIFTFVIAASLFLIVAAPSPPAFPREIPNGILILLGISASSYLVSKGIQFATPEGLTPQVSEVKIITSSQTATAGGPPVTLRAEVVGFSNPAVSWSVEPPAGMGTVDQSGNYTPPARPAAGPAPTGKVIVRAKSQQDPTVSDVDVITLV